MKNKFKRNKKKYIGIKKTYIKDKRINNNDDSLKYFFQH